MIIYRDIGMYIVAFLITIWIGWYGEITWWNSVILLLIYVALVGIVLIQEVLQKKNKGFLELDSSHQHNSTGHVQDPKAADEENHHNQNHNDLPINTSPSKSLKGNKLKGFKQLTSKHLMGNTEKMNSFGDVVLAAEKKFMISLFTKHKLEFLRLKREKKQNEEEHGHTSLLDSIIHIIEMPFLFILYLTALPVDEEQYSRLRCLIYPVPGFCFIWFVLHPTFDLTFIFYVLPLGIVGSLVMWLVLPADGSYPRWSMVFTVMSVVSGLMWSYLLINNLIDLLNVAGMLLNLEPTYLGLSVLAIGNALPDAFTTIALTAQGHAAMAISGGYAGQLFGYLMGFGVAMLKKCLKEGPQAFELFDISAFKENLLLMIVLWVSGFCLFLTFFWGYFNNFEMDRTFAYLQTVIYVLFLIVTTVLATWNAINNP